MIQGDIARDVGGEEEIKTRLKSNWFLSYFILCK